MTNLTAPAAIRGRLVGNRDAITARTIARREWVAANAHHGPAAIAAALGLSRHTIHNQYHTLFAAPPVARIERPAGDVTTVVYERYMASSSSQTAQRVNLPRMPWDDAERGPDARHAQETTAGRSSPESRRRPRKFGRGEAGPKKMVHV